ncbi:MAG: MBL fold metallo-hydrolase [Bacteroidales bacterium]|nr:MBL fold metallo-hydrolase [Bacteroidales bacterium]
MSDIRFISFSSGSAGNCYLLLHGGEGLLIDAGISLRRLRTCLGEHHLTTDCIRAVLITHNHWDHIRSLASYCAKLGRPVYSTAILREAMLRGFTTAPSFAACSRVLPEEGMEIGSFSVRAFEVPHDAAQTVGYSIDAGGFNYVHITDAGSISGDVVGICRRADALVLESNYDDDMLDSGPYTEELKERIRSSHGHLSNADCAEALSKIDHPGLGHIFLCHLSENNNTPVLAFKASSAVVGKDRLHCLPRTSESEMFTLR